nr:hypothetical protein [uncultured Prevotella sp.]
MKSSLVSVRRIYRGLPVGIIPVALTIPVILKKVRKGFDLAFLTVYTTSGWC